MLNFKIYPVILGLLLSFVTMAADNSVINDNGTVRLTGSIHKARIISTKAVVYADENMLTPLGYITNGKTITVGNPRRINRDLVPLVIYGRIAYIETKDIRFEDDIEEEYNTKRGAPREHDVDVTIQKPEERLSENNSVYLSYHRYNGGSEIKEFFRKMDGDERELMTGFHLQFIHRQSTSNLFWGVGLDYSSTSTPYVKFGYWLFSPTVGYGLLKNPLFSLDIYASVDLGLNLEYKNDDNYEEEPAGWIWGFQGNARVVFFPTAKYHAFLGMGIRKYNVTDLATVKDNDGVPTKGIKSLTGVSLFIGAGMEFR